MDFTVEDAFREGLKAQRAGNFELAEKFYLAILKAIPQHPDANHNLGVLYLGRHEPARSVPLFDAAVRANPNVAQFWVSLVESLIRSGELAKGQEVLRKAKRRFSDKRPFLPLASAIKKILETLEPPHEVLQPALEFMAKEDFQNAISETKRLKSDFPNSINIRKAKGESHREIEQYFEAMEEYKEIVSLFPDSAEGYFGLGEVYYQIDDQERARSSYLEAIKRDHKFGDAFWKLGYARNLVGDAVGARSDFEKALEIFPDRARYHRALSMSKKYTEMDDQFRKMLALYDDAKSDSDSKVHLCFALAKAYEDIGDIEQFFKYLKEGNALRKSVLEYDISKDIRLFDQIKSFQEQLDGIDSLAIQDVASPIPIFVLGMPRSGTTLTEQILSAHPKVQGAGELGYIARFWREMTAKEDVVTNEALLELREKYLDAIQKLTDGSPYLVDKMPHNFRFVGLIRKVFPEAKIVHVVRDAAAVCWSNYKLYFPANDLGYSFDLRDVVEFHGLYRDLMDFWRQRCPGAVYDLDYDQLTIDQEEQTRKLVTAIGLEWDDACLSPEDNQRAVRTASQEQVRKKVYSGSSQSWKKYVAFLEGAFDSLPTSNSQIDA